MIWARKGRENYDIYAGVMVYRSVDLSVGEEQQGKQMVCRLFFHHIYWCFERIFNGQCCSGTDRHIPMDSGRDLYDGQQHFDGSFISGDSVLFHHAGHVLLPPG